MECVSEKIRTKERILKHTARSSLELQEEVLQILLENLEKEGILENHGDNLNQYFCLKESIKVMQRKEKKRWNY